MSMNNPSKSVTKGELALLSLLTQDARKSVAEIARELGLARATVQERIRRLEEGGVIEGYTVRLNPAYSRSRVTAHTLVRIDARKADGLYAKLQAAGIDVLYDDTDERAGAKFSTLDLIGAPLQLIVGPKGVKSGEAEIKVRSTGEKATLPMDAALTRVINEIATGRKLAL